MLRIENQCVGCETCTLGSGCSLLNVWVYECDECGEDAAYRIDGVDYCENCARKMLEDTIAECTIDEMADMLDLKIEIID